MSLEYREDLSSFEYREDLSSLEFLKERDGLSLEDELELEYFLSECFDLYRSIL
ncbi:MAG: hypothetical protein JW390_60001 [Nitrosopumilus sp.]|nr:hypothetical protein [Candidatus Nitrosopumilus limneticus]